MHGSPRLLTKNACFIRENGGSLAPNWRGDVWCEILVFRSSKPPGERQSFAKRPKRKSAEAEALNVLYIQPGKFNMGKIWTRQDIGEDMNSCWLLTIPSEKLDWSHPVPSQFQFTFWELHEWSELVTITRIPWCEKCGKSLFISTCDVGRATVVTFVCCWCIFQGFPRKGWPGKPSRFQQEISVHKPTRVHDWNGGSFQNLLMGGNTNTVVTFTKLKLF